jgi:serine/threonine protein kinase
VSSFTPQPVGERFGRYVLLELIGRGGMAEVYRAVAHGLEGFQRVFVIKRILKEKCAHPEFVEMFVNEARISALLNHPNIVQIYDFGQIDGSYFLAMEHLRGKDLLSVLRQLRVAGTKMSPEVAAYLAQQVALGLDYAHTLTHAGKNLRIVHRDVSPSNVMLLRAGGVKLLDFGIAKAAMEIRTDSETQAGLVKGKLSYVSPEQIRGATDVDGRSDVFALGVVLWECLTGRRLFFDRNDFQTMRNVIERPVPPPSTQREEVPAALDFIVLRALEREPKRRYPDAKTMADELEAVLQEARFAPRAMTRMLDQLFGEASSQADLHVPEQPVEAGAGSLGNGVPVLVPIPDPPTAAMPEPAPDAFADDDEESYTGVSSVRRLPVRPQARRVSWMAAAAAVALVVTGGSVLLGAHSRRAQAPPEMPLAAVAPAETAEPVADPGPPSPPLGIEPAPVKVSVRIDSDPPGAEITGEGGKILGVTPATLAVVRSEKPLAFEINKAGYASSRHAVVPDRDISALLTLRAEDDPARRRAGHRRHQAAPPAAEGRVREGLSVDPFADDKKKTK